MNSAAQDTLLAFLENQIQACKTRSSALSADNRKDEAVFEEIRCNVYDIFRTVFQAGQKQFPENKEAQLRFFRERLDAIPKSWQSSLDAARQHEDSRKACIEEIKLEAVSHIRQFLPELWEDQP